jgi:UDP-N-acetylglucosamine 4-epimerase
VGLVRVLDNLATGHRSNLAAYEGLDHFEFVEGDIRDLETCQRACEGMDYVLHQAALGSVPRSLADPLTTNAVNITGFINMLSASKEAGVKRFVYAASSSTYGDSPGLPKVEDRIGNPLSPYAVTKYVNELYAGVFARCYGMETVGLRYFNVFGPRQDPNGAYAAVIPKFISLLLDNKSPLINGDGLVSRDFTFVANAVQANIRALFAPAKAANEVYNVALGDRTTLLDVTQTLKELTASEADITFGPPRPGDIAHSQADISKARRMLGYEPGVRIEDGLAATVAWFKEHRG